MIMVLYKYRILFLFIITRNVSFRQIHLLLPSTVQCKAVSGSALWDSRHTCPSYLQLRLCLRGQGYCVCLADQLETFQSWFLQKIPAVFWPNMKELAGVEGEGRGVEGEGRGVEGEWEWEGRGGENKNEDGGSGDGWWRWQQNGISDGIRRQKKI